jgi:hypothetical protein
MNFSVGRIGNPPYKIRAVQYATRITKAAINRINPMTRVMPDART